MIPTPHSLMLPFDSNSNCVSLQIIIAPTTDEDGPPFNVVNCDVVLGDDSDLFFASSDGKTQVVVLKFWGNGGSDCLISVHLIKYLNTSLKRLVMDFHRNKAQDLGSN